MSEFIYVLENPLMPGLVKIGRTERSVSERANELSSHSGVPTEFTVVKEYTVENSVEAERIIHERLSDYRVAENREFFKMEAEDATAIIDSILETAKNKPQRDFEREDELIARAIPIVVKNGMARPRSLEEKLGISYEEALFVIRALRGRGVIGEHNESRWVESSKPPVILQKPKPVTIAPPPIIGHYQLPPMDFLQHPDMTDMSPAWKEKLMANARLMQMTLAQHEIEASLGDITKGPTITSYKLHLAPGVLAENVFECSSELADALNVENVRIIRLDDEFLTVEESRIAVCIVSVEVPNAIKTKAIMRDLFEADEWRNSKAKIPIALGKDVYGHPIVADLAEMPHLLIAGDIGSGKSVCLNAIITSILYRFSPEQIRFVMIDPNGVELQLYNVLPHLVVPVVSDPQKAVLALRWVVNEMEKRFLLFVRAGCRNIGTFNARIKQNPVGSDEEGIVIPEKLSSIVVIIENVEDLMQVAKTDLELAMEHLTQTGRAAGIHLVLTTRQAGRNLISERIMAGIPARIAFRCASRIESRAIIGAAGAEKLSGKGDLLYLPPGTAKLIRVQGALIADYEINCIVEFIAKQGRPSYEMEIQRQLSMLGHSASGIDEDEELIQQCIEVIRSEQIASVSLLQRRLQLGYTRAARIMDELENRGIVGPGKGAEPREILIDLDVVVPVLAVKQPPITKPSLVVRLCEHCNGKIEFDANELGDRQSVSVPCPHCGVETILSNATS